MTTTDPKKTVKPLPTKVDRSTAAYGGTLTIDLTPLKALLVDLTQGSMKGLRRCGAGIDDVATELANVMPTAAGTASGVAPTLYQTFVTANGNRTSLLAAGTTIFKLAEVVKESLALAEDAEEQALSKIADAIQSTAKRDKNDGIKAPFAKTLAYKSAAAEKAVKTKAAKKAAAKTTTTTTGTTASGTTAAATPAAGATGSGH